LILAINCRGGNKYGAIRIYKSRNWLSIVELASALGAFISTKVEIGYQL